MGGPGVCCPQRLTHRYRPSIESIVRSEQTR
jgi:hypothetical protein